MVVNNIQFEIFKKTCISAANKLKGAEKRQYMAEVVKELGKGGQLLANKAFGWNRDTVRKGLHELRTGISCADAHHLKGRKPTEKHLPNLLKDIKEIVDGQSQTDPQFRNQRLYTRLTAAEVRRQLIAQKGYTDEQLPTAETIGTKLNNLGYYLKKVQKTIPKKK